MIGGVLMGASLAGLLLKVKNKNINKITICWTKKRLKCPNFSIDGRFSTTASFTSGVPSCLHAPSLLSGRNIRCMYRQGIYKKTSYSIFAPFCHFWQILPMQCATGGEALWSCPPWGLTLAPSSSWACWGKGGRILTASASAASASAAVGRGGGGLHSAASHKKVEWNTARSEGANRQCFALKEPTKIWFFSIKEIQSIKGVHRVVEVINFSFVFFFLVTRYETLLVRFLWHQLFEAGLMKWT